MDSVFPSNASGTRHACGVFLLAMLVILGCAHGPTAKEKERALVQHDLGAAALHQAKHREALAELLKGAELDPENAEIQYALGICYFTGFGRLEDAERHLKRAADLKANYSDAYNALGNIYLARNQCERAIPWLEKAKNNLLWPTPYLAEQNLGWCLYKTGKTDAGIAHLKSAVNMHPTLCGGYDYLAEIYIQTGKESESIPWLERYIKHCDTEQIRKFLPPSQLASVYYRLGGAFLRGGNRELARQHLATCVERFGEDPTATECKKSLTLLD